MTKTVNQDLSCFTGTHGGKQGNFANIQPAVFYCSVQISDAWPSPELPVCLPVKVQVLMADARHAMTHSWLKIGKVFLRSPGDAVVYLHFDLYVRL